jgi:hypothetical protein
MERFAAMEVADKLQPLSVRPTDGKLHFLLPAPPSTPSLSTSPPSPAPPAPAASTQPLSAAADEAAVMMERLRGLKTAERLFVQVLAHFETTSGTAGSDDKTGGSTTGSNPFRIYEHGGLFVMVGWAVNYAHLWEQAVRALRRYTHADLACLLARSV